MSNRLIVSSPPYLKTGETAHCLMFDVCVAAIPIMAASTFFFGPRALWVVFWGISSAVTTEAFIQILFRSPGFRFRPFLYNFLTNDNVTVFDGSAMVTGLLLSFSLPPGSPFWMPVVGSFVAVAIGKQVFGGLGYNIFNPALVGRAFVLAAWPGKATTFTEPIRWGAWAQTLGFNPASWVIDGVSTATPLTLLKLQGQEAPLFDLIVGRIPGSLGETSAIAILLGAAYLLYKGTISWHVPVSFVGTVFLLSLVLGQNPAFHVFSGSLLLGAFFFATDVVTSPVTKWGRLIFGGGAGLVTLLVRMYGAYPEGVCYSILLMNALTPLIDKYARRSYNQPAQEVLTAKKGGVEN